MQIPSNGTPLPIFGSIDQAGTHGIQVNVVQLFCQLRLGVDVEDVRLRLPESIALSELIEVTRCIVPVPFTDMITAHPFEAMSETCQHAGVWQPEVHVDVIWHQHESHTVRVEGMELMMERAKHNSIRLIQVQEQRLR